ncbi:MAG: hypothetical protein E6J34_17270 [Chloroflexi bacterium]|nr:MAG: hypothetical protein E6J34_17270 [Chloroflexota bacterium]
MQLTRGKACAFTRNDGKAGGAGGRLALLTGCGVSPQPLFSSAAEGGKTDKTGKRISPQFIVPGTQANKTGAMNCAATVIIGGYSAINCATTIGTSGL